ncbi:hypothetical protein R5R35_003047 [Gryllus longicercus]|uniref:PCI domain-containing protein n=1 Tax=Gryllus longicercus TaxID=2509291 RepID=A0AAN9VR93_9ORTH
MGDKCQNPQMPSPWQYPPPYGVYPPYPGQPYGHPGYSYLPHYYYNSGMAFNHNPGQTQNMQHNQNNPIGQAPQNMNQNLMNKSFQSDYGQQNSNSSNNQSDSCEKTTDNEMPPLPPGPPPPLNNHSYQTPPPPGTAPIVRNPFYGQPSNAPYGPIKFNLPMKKAGLGFHVKPFNNMGGGKKKRKKNKNNANNNQFNNSFSNSPSPIPNNVMFMNPPPLPPKEEPVFPPLPPLPAEPCPEPPNDADDKMEISSNKSSEGVPEKSFSSAPTLEERPSINNAESLVVTTPTGQLTDASDWPDSLKNYVNRCYAKCVEAVDKDRVEIILKGKITRAASDGSLWHKNWDNEPLPSLHNERKFEPKKIFQPANLDNLGQRQSPAKQSPIRPKKSGISAALGSRLGGRAYRVPRRSRSRSRSSSRDRSRSPARRRRTRSDSSSSSDDNFKSLRVNKRLGRNGDRLSNKGRNNNKMKGKNKQNNSNKIKSHFYSEYGILGGVTEDLGSSERLQQRAARFNSSLKSSPNTNSPMPVVRRKKPLSFIASMNNMVVMEDTNGEGDWADLHIVGTCQDIEKPYLRLTSAPEASAVRPIEVLKVALQKVQEKWSQSQDYRYVCDQLKSIRQDLTVQGIRDKFTVQVYESHARIALEKGDHEEFNQCQTQLKMLYSEVGGNNKLEFTAYRILYYIFTKNTLDLTTILSSLTMEDKVDECVSHALEVRSAWWLGNYHKFFKLFRQAPRMGGYLIEWFIERERKAALKCMIKSYRPFIPASLVMQELAFDSDEKCLEFLAPFGLTFMDAERTKIDCKASVASINSV